MTGNILDELSDPPFTIGAIDTQSSLPSRGSFGGPTIGTTYPRGPTAPEPATLSLPALGGMASLPPQAKADLADVAPQGTAYWPV